MELTGVVYTILDDIIKRRLTIDGEGVGDDRKINLLLKTFQRWTNAVEEKEDALLTQDRILTQLSHNEFSVLKSELAEQMIEAELKNYKKVSDNIEVQIEQAKRQIAESKDQLVSAKEIRRNKLEYSSLARLIKQEPDRKEIMALKDSLTNELQLQNEQFQKVNRKLEDRRRAFKSFMMSLNSMQSLLSTDAEVEETNEDEDDEMMLID